VTAQSTSIGSTCAGSVDLCVVHLVRRGGELGSLRRFVDSYNEYDAGVSHRLVLLLKGFQSKEEVRPYERVAEPLSYEKIEVSDEGFDLTAYTKAARRLDCSRVCFLNSHSRILDSGWLGKLSSALTPGVGIVGATGSWNSPLSVTHYLLGLPSAYRELFTDRAWFRRQMHMYALAVAGPGGDAVTPSPQSRALAVLRANVGMAYVQGAFRRFPAHHVRTNAFLVPAEVFRRLRTGRLHFKQQVWRLESGRGSITAQIEAMGLSALLVGRDGFPYKPGDWHDSATFWQERQQNLLVADNHTEAYRLGDLDRRTLLARLAWGDRARPQSP
jgi:hypothetical protein